MAGEPSPAGSRCPLCGGVGCYDMTGTDLMFGGTTEYRYERCGDCGTVYMLPIPSITTIATFYPGDYSVYRPPKRARVSPLDAAVLRRRYGYAHLEAPWWAKLLAPLPRPREPEWVDFRGGGRAVDVGCGNGSFLLRLEQLGWQVQGVEFNARAAQLCRDAGLTIFQGELTEAGLAPGSFDLITARHLIEHVSDPASLVVEMARLLTPGGRLLLLTPNAEALGRSRFGRHWFANDVPRHLYLHTARGLNRIAAEAGLTLVHAHTSTSPKLYGRSLDYRHGRSLRSRAVAKLASRPFGWKAARQGRGDELVLLYRKA